MAGLVGEVLFCSEDTDGTLTSVESYNGKLILSLGGGEDSLFAIESDGNISKVLANIQDQDFTGSQASTNTEAQINTLSQLTTIRSGKEFKIFLTADGFVYSSGTGQFGVLGQGGSGDYAQPTLIKPLSDKTIAKVVCGESHTLALTDNGDVYSWGRGYEGQLGIRKSIETVSIPKYIDTLFRKRVVDIACGSRHSMAIDENGDLYTWGEGRCGQLGRGKERSTIYPTKVEFFDDENNPMQVKIKVASAGVGHSACITENNELFTWGLNNYGQLGTGDNVTQWSPVQLTHDTGAYVLQPILSVDCCSFSTFVIDESGRLFSFGKGYLGHGGETLEFAPKKIDVNTENRIFTNLFCGNRSMVSFSPLRIFHVSPNCGPANGGTKLCLMGTAFSGTTDLKVRFRYADLILEEPGTFYYETSSIAVTTPNFADGERLSLPMEVSIDVTMDGENYVQCEEKFFIYSNDIVPQNIFPKSASIHGGSKLSLDMPLINIPDDHLFHIVVRFQNKVKKYNFAGDLKDPRNLQDVGNEYMLVDGHYENNQIVCEVPKLVDNTELTYLVDVAINAQQFTGKPINFRYYDVQIEGISPVTGFMRGGTTLRILGNGLYDSSGKKLVLSTMHGERTRNLQWNHKDKSIVCVMPPFNWMFGGEDPTEEQLADGTTVNCALTLNGIDYFELPNFVYRDISVEKLSIHTITEENGEQWPIEESEAEEEIPEEEKAKYEAELAALLEKSQRPGTKMFIWSNDLVRTKDYMIQFTIEEHVVEVPGLYKGKDRIGVEVPDLGEHMTAVECTVEASINGQEYSCSGKTFKYLGANAPEEKVVGRRK